MFTKTIGGYIFAAFMTLSFGAIILHLETHEWSQEKTSVYHSHGSNFNRTPKTILLWSRWYGDGLWQRIMAGKQEVSLNCQTRCTVYNVSINPLLFDVIIFNGRDRLPTREPKVRRKEQIYIMYTKESPFAMGPYVKDTNFYNWTATYSPLSDIWLPYWFIVKKNKHTKQAIKKSTWLSLNYNHSSEEAMVLWIVSHCYTPGRRELYVRNLMRHINVDIYGGCGKRCLKNRTLSGTACIKALVHTGKYKFYLSFENVACMAYTTEKVEVPLRYGLVPIVYGGLKPEDYLNRLPPNSFIDVRNFESPKELASYLRYLDGNETAYIAYHAWRYEYDFAKLNQPCKICNALHNISKTSTHKNVDWGKFWNRSEGCIAGLINKVLGQ